MSDEFTKFDPAQIARRRNRRRKPMGTPDPQTDKTAPKKMSFLAASKIATRAARQAGFKEEEHGVVKLTEYATKHAASITEAVEVLKAYNSKK